MEIDCYNEEDEKTEKIEEMLFDMSTDDFIENEIDNQMTEDIFIDSANKRNYVELYIEKYKYLKSLYKENKEEELETLEENKNAFIDNIINKIATEFSVEVDDEAFGKKMAKTLYNFFVINYTDNLKDFFINFLQKNKKSIVNYLKNHKSKNRDITSIASKIKYFNSNDALIINNVSNILKTIIPSMCDKTFINYIIDYDDCTVNKNMKKFIENEDIIISDETYNSFLKPFIDEYDDYSTIITDITLELANSIKQNNIDVF